MNPSFISFQLTQIYIMKTTSYYKYLGIILLVHLIHLSFPPLLLAQDEETEKNGTTVYSSVEERRLHALMQNERENILRDKKVLELKEKELKTLEAAVDKKIGEIDRKLAELQQMQKKIKELLAEKSGVERKRIQNLGKIFEKMTPGKAALAISGMDQQLATDLLGAMKPKAAAKVLNMLDKNKAAQLSTSFSQIQLE